MRTTEKTLNKTINASISHLRAAAYTMLFIVVFFMSPSYAKDFSILMLDQGSKNFSENIINNIQKNTQHHVKINNTSISDDISVNDINAYDLIITLGNLSAKYILDKKPKKPLLSLLITKRALKLLNANYKPKHLWSSISLDQPIKRQLLLIKKLLGESKTVGTIFGVESKNIKNNIIDSIESTKLKLAHETITNSDQLIPSIKTLIVKSDVILAVPDPVAFNRKTIRGILLLSFRKETPVIGFSKSYVKAGAIAAVYSSPKQISQQAAEEIESFIHTGILEPGNSEPKYFSIETNKNVAHTLNIKLKDNKTLTTEIMHEEASK